MKHVVKSLEYKILGMCDPSIGQSSRFRKLQYKLPNELKKYADKDRLQEGAKWSCILHNVTLGNIHMYTDGRPSFKKDDGLVETLLKQFD
jgi:hypothetical protein